MVEQHTDAHEEKQMPEQEQCDAHGICGHERLRADEDRWIALAFVGIQECGALREPDDIIELRNCTCGSTLGRRQRRRRMP